MHPSKSVHSLTTTQDKRYLLLPELEKINKWRRKELKKERRQIPDKSKDYFNRSYLLGGLTNSAQLILIVMDDR